MLTAFGFSFAAWILILLAALALGRNDSIVEAFPWARGYVESPGRFIATVSVGIRHRVIVLEPIPPFEIPPDIPSIISTGWWDDSCSGFDVLNATCDECRDGLPQTQTLILTSILTQTIQMATDLQRTTPYGDLNCQKAMGILTGLYGLTSGLLSLRAFANTCWRAQPDAFTLEDWPLLGELAASFTFGPGAVLMFVATALKAIDIFCHAIVPTPTPRHSKPPAAVDTLPEYLAIGQLDIPTCWGYTNTATLQDYDDGGAELSGIELSGVEMSGSEQGADAIVGAEGAAKAPPPAAAVGA